ncbi:MAG: hypothetical protein KDD54_04195 [Flavobacteriales bacterium]|nr:hypothetical protein [Flavobacteriales bacterium]
MLISKSKLQYKCLCLLIFATVIVGCATDDKKQDDFYSVGCGSDCRRIPLLKPYFASSTTGIDGQWYLDNGQEGIKVQFLNVVDSVIVSCYYNASITVPENRDTTWYIHEPSKIKMYKFSSEAKFQEKLNEFTDQPAVFLDIKNLYRELVDKGYLDWFPDDFKAKKSSRIASIE